jgi:hypothetical protein
VQLASAYTERHGDSLSFRFTGTVTADTMTGTLDMGEYLTAKWTAKRHDYGEAERMRSTGSRRGRRVSWRCRASATAAGAAEVRPAAQGRPRHRSRNRISAVRDVADRGRQGGGRRRRIDPAEALKVVDVSGST